MNPKQITKFQNSVWGYYRTHKRALPWRTPDANNHYDPYKILVSEIMLQQTQVPRVAHKFETFIQQFPTIDSLSAAPMSEVIVAWSGLGYNRRAKFLWQAAQHITNNYASRVPEEIEELVRLPGIGKNTAAAILTYAYNQRHVFIETNIRTVYIYHFYPSKIDISDSELLKHVHKSLPKKDCREWYWALMDHGTYIKSKHGNLSAKSRHYKKQSAFSGSSRQLRGEVLRQLGSGPKDINEFKKSVSDNRLPKVLSSLQTEGLIHKKGASYRLGNV